MHAWCEIIEHNETVYNVHTDHTVFFVFFFWGGGGGGGGGGVVVVVFLNKFQQANKKIAN